MSLNGLEPDGKTGLIKATYLTKLPEWYQVGTWKEPEATKWYTTLASHLNGWPGNTDPNLTPNITTTYLWENRNKTLPFASKNVSWQLGAIEALAKFVQRGQAEAIGNWLGGSYQYKTIFGGLTRTAYDMDDFLDADKCYGYYNPEVKISDALEALKASNKAAHDWVVRAAAAKAAKKAVHEATMYQKTIEKQKEVVAKAVEKTAEKTAEVAKAAGDAVGDTISVAAFLIKNIWWIAPVVVGGVGYVVWRNRKTVAKLAVAGATGGVGAAALAAGSEISKNPRRRK